jgi:hypothetical protein
VSTANEEIIEVLLSKQQLHELVDTHVPKITSDKLMV